MLQFRHIYQGSSREQSGMYQPPTPYKTIRTFDSLTFRPVAGELSAPVYTVGLCAAACLGTGRLLLVAA